VLVANKGFGSEENFSLLEEAGIGYVVPLRRSSSALDPELLRRGLSEGFSESFLYNGRPVSCHIEEREDAVYATFVDSALRLKEETDYMRRIEEKREGCTQEGLSERRHKLGSIIMRTNLRGRSAREIYETYKSRSLIEQGFDVYKGMLGLDASCMRSDESFEGWALIGHVSLMMSYALQEALREAGLSLSSRWKTRCSISQASARYASMGSGSHRKLEKRPEI
jgi:transposase